MDQSEEIPARRSRRLSITRLQRGEAAVAELINLVQTVTADGHLTDEEISDLRNWLADNASLNIPAHDYLLNTVQHILDDGVVTQDERTALFLAIELVLPADVRAEVRGARRARGDDERIQHRNERRKAEMRARDIRAVNRPVASWKFMVAGVHHEGPAGVIREHASPGDRVLVCRDPGNTHSANACQVRLMNDLQIGYVPEDQAASLAPALDTGQLYSAYITKILTGGRYRIPVVRLELYAPGATPPDPTRPSVGAILQGAGSERGLGSSSNNITAPKSHRSGCLSRASVALIVLPALAWLVA